MTPAALLLELSQRGISLEAIGGEIRCRAGRGTITPDLLAAIRRHKKALLKMCAGRADPVPNLGALGRAYCQHIGGDVVAAFREVTGCDVHERVPSWLELYLFEAWVMTHMPGEPCS